MNSKGEMAPTMKAEGRRTSWLLVAQKGEGRGAAAELSHQRHLGLCAENKSGGGTVNQSRGRGGREHRNTSVHLSVNSNFIFTSVDEISSCSVLLVVMVKAMGAVVVI